MSVELRPSRTCWGVAPRGSIHGIKHEVGVDHSDCCENWVQSGFSDKVIWDPSGNEFVNLPRKIEEKIRNMAITLNSQLSPQTS